MRLRFWRVWCEVVGHYLITTGNHWACRRCGEFYYAGWSRGIL